MKQIPAAAEIESKPEPWLRGTLATLPPEQRAVLHAIELAREDIARWCGSLSDEELNAGPHGLPSVAFHLRHIVGSLDRLLTYADARTLNAAQMQWLAAEMSASTHREQLFSDFSKGLAAAESRISAIDPAIWPEVREVGRKRLPTTVAGLLVHCSEHTQRHTGQAITTAKIVLALRKGSQSERSGAK